MTHSRFFGKVAFTALAVLGTSCSSSTPGGGGGGSNAGQGGATAKGGTAAGGAGAGGQSGSAGVGGTGGGGGGSNAGQGGATAKGGAAAGGAGAGGQSGSAGVGGTGGGGAAGANAGGGTVTSGGQSGAGGRSGAGGANSDGGPTGTGGKTSAGGTSGGIDASAGGSCAASTAADPTTTSIAGTWDFTPSGGVKRTITVPGGGWLKQGITASSATYATQITVPDSGAAQSTLIEFGAANFQSTLSVDGKEVGTNTTSFTPSVFDVTKFVTPGKQHAISVLVKGGQALKTNGKFIVPVAADWSPNVPQGIFRSALLHVYPDVYVSDAFVKTSVTDDTMTYEVSVANTGTTSQDVTLSGALSSWNCDTFAYPSIPDTTVTAAPGTTTKKTIGPIKWGLGTTSYWWPNVPYQPDYKARLHNLTLQVKSGGKVTQSKVV
ncbi:MAG TPA: hypothetical protein VF550_16550, partial [Polyangia bacterium]